MATTEVKRFWMAPKSARAPLTDFRAASTISSAFWAPSNVVMSRSLAKLAVAVAAAVASAMPVRPTSVAPPVMVPAVMSKSLPALTEVMITLPASAPVPTEAATPVSPSLAFTAVAMAWAMSVPAAPFFHSTSAMVTPLICMPASLPSAVAAAAAVVAVCLAANFTSPRDCERASTTLSMAMAWPALAPTWNSWLVNDPSSSLVPLKSACLATRSISEVSCLTSAFSAARSDEEFVALADCTDSSRMRCRLLPISVSEPSAT